MPLKPYSFSIRRIAIEQLSAREREELWSCYNRFVICSRDSFMESLSHAGEVYTVRDRATGTLHGFEALSVIPVRVEGRTLLVIFTFYADLDPEYRGRNILQRIGIETYLKLRCRYPLRPIFWLFTASSYTSYLLLPRNFVHYWPRPNLQTPPLAREIMDTVMQRFERSGWDAAAGVVRRQGALRYREGVVADDETVVADPDIAFFARVNPGQSEGDTLVCLCPLTMRNFASVAIRLVCRGWRNLKKD